MTRRREPETARIDSLTHDGRGIAAIAGKKIFVPGALPGEEVRVLRRKIRRGHDEADLLEVLAPSPERVEPRCEAFGICGGCALQHIDAAKQREIKQKSLKDSLERIGSVSPGRWLPPLYEAEEEGAWQYRRRARLAVRDVAAKGRVLVGFKERGAAMVTDMHRCEVLSPPLGELIDPLSDLVGELSIRARLPQVELAVGDNAVELLFRVLDPPTADDRAKLLQFGRRHGVRVSLQPGGLESVVPLDPETPRDALWYELPEFEVRMYFEATDFVQVNGPVNRQMVARAVDLLQLTEHDRVLDLYCGIGNFSLPMARRAGNVLGIEGEAALVKRASLNADRNGIANCEFRVSDLAAVEGKEQWMRQSWNKVLLDPPRSGAEALVRSLAKTGAERVVYVSCHPATLARDAGILSRSQGYRLEAAGIVDMFPHTAHVEAIALFCR
jgi:23S rRNA (uracil1939-C5)-methyltransferase